MTLAELAALAAKVEGFVRPFHKCARCNGRGEVFHDVLHDDVTCAACDGTKGRFDNSPAALLMAVMLYARKHHGDVEMNGASVAVRAMQIGPTMRRGRAAIPEETEESIARAALVALLRAHGVEVPNG